MIGKCIYSKEEMSVKQSEIDRLTKDNERLNNIASKNFQSAMENMERTEKAEAERDRLREALQWLVRLKDTKDKHGKTTEYLEDKEPAWTAAREALK